MAKKYELSTGRRSANRLFGFLAACGLGGRYLHVLSVRGRTSGKLHSTPVDVMQDGDDRWLVAPYGAVNWVRNLRAADGDLTLRRGKRIEHLHAREITPGEAVPVIRKYIRSVPITRDYWNVTADSTDQDIAREGLQHPVFRLIAALT